MSADEHIESVWGHDLTPNDAEQVAATAEAIDQERRRVEPIPDVRPAAPDVRYLPPAASWAGLNLDARPNPLAVPDGEAVDRIRAALPELREVVNIELGRYKPLGTALHQALDDVAALLDLIDKNTTGKGGAADLVSPDGDADSIADMRDRDGDGASSHDAGPATSEAPPAFALAAPLAVPDTVRRAVWAVADALGDEVQRVAWETGSVRVEMARHEVFLHTVTVAWDVIDAATRVQIDINDLDTGGLLVAAAREVEQWASGLVAEAVTDGDWSRPT